MTVGLCFVAFDHTGRGMRVGIMQACVVFARGAVSCVPGVPLWFAMLRWSGAAEFSRSRSPKGRVALMSDLPSPPTPRSAWWAHNCHNAQLRVALKHGIDNIVRAALDKRKMWLIADEEEMCP